MWALRQRPSEPVLSAWSDDEDGEEVVLWGHHRMERLAGKELQRERRTASMRRCLTAGVFCGAGAALTFTVGAILIALPRFIEMQHDLISERAAFGVQQRALHEQPVLSEEVMLTDTSMARTAAPPSLGADTLGQLSHALGLGQDVGLLRPGLATVSALAGSQESARSAPAPVGHSSSHRQQQQQQGGQQQEQGPPSEHEPPVAAHFEPQFYRAAQCMSWCMTHEKDGAPSPWPERCAWDTMACSACPECDAPLPGTHGNGGSAAGALTPPGVEVTALAAASTDAPTTSNATSEEQAAGAEKGGAESDDEAQEGDAEDETEEAEGEGDEGQAEEGRQEEEVDAEVDAVANGAGEGASQGGGQQQQQRQQQQRQQQQQRLFQASTQHAEEQPPPAQDASNGTAPEDPAQESRSAPEEPAQERQHTMQLGSSWQQQQQQARPQAVVLGSSWPQQRQPPQPQQRQQEPPQQQAHPQARVNDSTVASTPPSARSDALGVEAKATTDAAADAPAAAPTEPVANTSEQEAEPAVANATARAWEVRPARTEEAPALDGGRRHQQGESTIAAAAAELRADATREAELAAEAMREAGQQAQRRRQQRQQEAERLAREWETSHSHNSQAHEQQRPPTSR